MITATHISKKSALMSAIRENLLKKTAPGEPTPSRKEARARWREDILGIFPYVSKRQQPYENQASNESLSDPTVE